jgi:uncharacterized protein with HEPN domain
MSPKELLIAEKAYLAQLLEAIQRCVYFLNATTKKLPFPLHGDELKKHKKDVNLFESLSSFNERFAKFQDTLASAMRHAYLLSGEKNEHFLKVLAFYEKYAVIESIESWQQLRTARNLAAHDYETDYFQIAEHFNGLRELSVVLYQIAGNFTAFCANELKIEPTSADFSDEFLQIVTESRK